MDALIETIRAAIAPDAAPEVRATGADACRTILAALGASQGQPLGAAPHVEPGPVATAVASLIRSTPPDQLLDLAIAKLRSMVPADARPISTSSLRFHYVPVPGQRPIAASPAMSYVRVREDPQGRIAHDPAVTATEGRAGTGGGNGAAQPESVSGAGAGGVPGGSP